MCKPSTKQQECLSVENLCETIQVKAYEHCYEYCTPDQGSTSVTSVSPLVKWEMKIPTSHVSLLVNKCTNT